MREMVVLSGKGGTGKTSLVASLAVLAAPVAMADCDVDAANLHLLLEPRIRSRREFSGSLLARIQPELCTSCGRCREVCRFGAIGPEDPPVVDPLACEGCGVCHWACPADAIQFRDARTGWIIESSTRAGPLVHARLGVAQESSGKLVTEVRRRARVVARQDGLDRLILDGSPGIGCPVIASLTGVDLVVAVTEPTLAGRHDLERLIQLARSFESLVAVVVNRWDLNPELTERIEQEAREMGARPVGRLPYDPLFSRAMRAGKPVVEFAPNGLAGEIRNVWKSIHTLWEGKSL